MVVGVDDGCADEALLVASRSEAEAFGLFYERRVDAVLAITKAHLAGFEGCLTANDKREFPSNVAERIDVAEQQVQRWEANDYSSVGLDRLQSLADALGVQIHETITYSSAA